MSKSAPAGGKGACSSFIIVSLMVMKDGLITAFQSKQIYEDAQPWFYVASSAKYLLWKGFSIYQWVQSRDIFYELLKLNQTIGEEWYGAHLVRLGREVCEKRPHFKQRHNKGLFNSKERLGRTLPNPLKLLRNSQIGSLNALDTIIRCCTSRDIVSLFDGTWIW